MNFTNLPDFGRRKMALYILKELDRLYGENSINIVETGTIRRNDKMYMLGDGHLTKAWGWYASITNSYVWTVDIDEKAIDVCKEVTKEWSPYISYVCQDSIQFLKEFDQTIHFLYLDSYDSDWTNLETIKAACQHQYNEIISAFDKLHNKCYVLLDDVRKDLKGGKSELSSKYLLDNGYEIKLFMPDDGFGNGQLLLGKI